ncbi:hypothetical protein SISNIDRAFT_491899 [Sistotremastrum niveocremeum HHB9708]|uniref:DUF6533 domain-containing protein n=1 Tax=Sistotremastrum niveocremeum HHB9708 TaxID=1314777 RepID=A0A164M9I3_9AGAM|nr:hypothetical protein SISNIDRAFT_491899 [Sistotremastrum niveocremeum HHB9708]
MPAPSSPPSTATSDSHQLIHISFPVQGRELFQSCFPLARVLNPLSTPPAAVATLTVLAYDWLLTLDSEVIYVWSAYRHTIPQVLYIVTRYLPLISQTINVLAQALSQSAPRLYVSALPFNPQPTRIPLDVRTYWLVNWNFEVTELIVIQALLAYRIRALYLATPTVTLTLILLFSMSTTSALTLLVLSLITAESHNRQPTSPLCLLPLLSRFQWAFWIPLFVFDAFAFAREINDANGETIRRNYLIHVLSRDSSLYFSSYVIIPLIPHHTLQCPHRVSLLYFIIIFLVRFTTGTVYLSTESVVYSLASILSCRMLLNLWSTRDEEFSSRSSSTALELDPVRFAPVTP